MYIFLKHFQTKKIAADLMPFLVKCLYAYLSLVKRVDELDPDRHNLNKILPPYFQYQRSIMARELSPTEAFLQDSRYCVFSTSPEHTKDVYVSKLVLYQGYEQYCKENCLKPDRWDSGTDTVSNLYVCFASLTIVCARFLGHMESPSWATDQIGFGGITLDNWVHRSRL